ncbi:MAG: peptidase [Bdellovibrionota bacterium]
MARTKARGKKKELIVIDEQKGLIFESEKHLFDYFEPLIQQLEEEYAKTRVEHDYDDEEQVSREWALDETLQNPDQIWKTDKLSSEFAMCTFIRHIERPQEEFYYIAICYVSAEDQTPTFVCIHFPTRFSAFVEKYRRGDLVFDFQVEKAQIAALEGDALTEGDALALGLYQSMVTLRTEKDIPIFEFPNYAALREDTIEQPDEIWRKSDLDGHILVTFIKEYPDHELGDFTYIALTLEDATSEVHSLLFSFPTNDESLVDRYRQGENLQAEEVSQESSH